jgi:cyclic pyranopterin phosphate synthase
MRDACGRTVRYLRLSLTSACPMRCVYCRPESLTRDSDAALLRPDEIDAMVRHLVQRHGLTKVRLTGGEPTARGDLLDVIRRLARIDGLAELAMTTNGRTLADDARTLAEAGLVRVNVSLDSLEPRRFRQITGADTLPRVLRGIDAALAAGLSPVKLNTVVLRGVNDHELPELVRFAADKGVEVRFIELMPMGPPAASWQQRFVPADEMRQRLNSAVASWRSLPGGPESSRRYRVTLIDGREVGIGFIAPMSRPFCDSCDRIRIAADGTFYPCLMSGPPGNLLPAIRPMFDAQRFDSLLQGWLQAKLPEHPTCGAAVMTHVGG